MDGVSHTPIGAPVTTARPGPASKPPLPDPAPGEFRLNDVVMLSGDLKQPEIAPGITLTIGDGGVSVRRSTDGTSRLLPWSMLRAHVVEPWASPEATEWWVDPELSEVPARKGFDFSSTVAPDLLERYGHRGAVISLLTPSGTFRFVVPGGNAEAIADRLAESAVVHLGPSAAPATSTVAVPAGSTPSTYHRRTDRWTRIRPFAVTVLVVLFVACALVILLQSAGRIHLPFLGGASPNGLRATASALHGWLAAPAR